MNEIQRKSIFVSGFTTTEWDWEQTSGEEKLWLVKESSRAWFVGLRPTGTLTLQVEDMKVFPQRAWPLVWPLTMVSTFPGEPEEKGSLGTAGYDCKGMFRSQKNCLSLRIVQWHTASSQEPWVNEKRVTQAIGHFIQWLFTICRTLHSGFWTNPVMPVLYTVSMKYQRGPDGQRWK